MWLALVLYKYFWSKVNIWTVNCAQATTFVFDTRTDVLVKVSKFLRQKMSRPERDSNPQLSHIWVPNLAITVLTDALAPNVLDHQQDTLTTRALRINSFQDSQTFTNSNQLPVTRWRHPKWPTGSRAILRHTLSIKMNVLMLALNNMRYVRSRHMTKRLWDPSYTPRGPTH